MANKNPSIPETATSQPASLVGPHFTGSLVKVGEGLLYCYKGTNITGKRVIDHPKMQLNDALIKSHSDSRFCQFSLAPEPLWAWVCSALDPQDAINELLNCV